MSFSPIITQRIAELHQQDLRAAVRQSRAVPGLESTRRAGVRRLATPRSMLQRLFTHAEALLRRPDTSPADGLTDAGQGLATVL
jgi:hypothetical protein